MNQLTSAEDLLFMFNEYKEDIKSKGYIKRDNIKSGEDAGAVIQHVVPKPLSVESFCLFADIEPQTFNVWLNRYRSVLAEISETEETFEEYFNSLTKESQKQSLKLYQTASRIRSEIMDHITGGGIANVYNPTLAAAITGLKNAQDDAEAFAKSVGNINITINGDKVDLG